MAKYLVKKIYKVVEEVEVWAEDESEAQGVAMEKDGEQTDYYLFDIDVEMIG